MKVLSKALIYKYARELHAWVGIIVFLLVFNAGFTGFCLNHSDTVSKSLQPAPLDETQFLDLADSQSASISSAQRLAHQIWPAAKIRRITSRKHHDRPSNQIATDADLLIANKATGQYFIKAMFTRETYDPDGSLIHEKFYWGGLFKWHHVRGWPTEFLARS